MRLIAVAGVAALIALGASVAGGSARGGYDRSIDRFLERVLPAKAGGAFVVADGKKLVHCEGVGLADRSLGAKATCDTAYDVMSMTKQFTAAAILKLEMTGKLRVSDRIGRIFGGVPWDKREITVRQLLTHTSGLAPALGGDYERLSRAEMVAGALGTKLRSTPGETYRYSNLGYSLLAAIVEKASGEGYEEFLRKRLFLPSRMMKTGYVLPRWKRSAVAVEYDQQGRSHGRPFDHPWARSGPYWNLRGNGGMLSTARDMFRWHRALEGTSVLDERAKRAMFKPHVAEQPSGESFYGYGWVVVDTKFGEVATHNGGNGWSYGELVRVLDDGRMVFWVTNQVRDAEAGWNLYELSPRITSGLVSRAERG